MIFRISLTVLSFLLVIKIISGQIDYEPGYYIDNEGQRLEGLILNIDWKNNPSAFKFKSTKAGDEREIPISECQVFGVNDFSRYERHKVKMDMSLNGTKGLSKVRNPIFEEKTLWLKVLVEGELSLYKFENQDYLRFFFSPKDGEVEQLIYKRFMTRTEQIAKNVYYQQQIINLREFSPNFKAKLAKVEYREKPLVDLFEELNDTSEYITYSSERTSYRPNFLLRLGTRYVNNEISNISSRYMGKSPLDFSYILGAEAEFILPFRREMWTVFVGGYYNTYQGLKDFEYENGTGLESVGKIEVNYTSAEFSAGFKNRFFRNGKPKYFVTGSFSYHVPVKTKLILPDDTELLLNRSNHLNLGVGYYVTQRLQAEITYSTSRNFLSTYSFWTADQQGVGLSVKYRLF